MKLPAEITASHTLFFGSGVRLNFPENVEDLGGNLPSAHDHVILPCCLGNVLQGPKLLALGEPAAGFPDNVSPVERGKFLGTVYERAKLVVVVVSDNMTDQCRVLNPHERVNGLFIVQPKASYHLSILDKKEAREEFLVNLSVNAVTALAAQSIVVVQLARGSFKDQCDI